MDNLLYDCKRKPKTGLWFLLSFQHVFAMFSATVLVPALTGLPVSVALFSSGVGTLIYILCTKGRVPIYLGSSFAYIAYIQSVAGLSGENFGAALTGIVAVGIIYLIVSLIIKFAGVNWLKKLLPPVVIGSMIIVIGLSLADEAVKMTGLCQESQDWTVIIVALVTMLVVALFAIRAKGFWKVIPFLIGIVSGYLLALILRGIKSNSTLFLADGIDKLQVLKETIKKPKQWFSLPEFIFLGWKDADLGAGVKMAKVNFQAVLPVIPLAFATLSEHIGDHQVLSKITGRDYFVDPGLHRTVMGDGVATLFAGLIGGPANTSYGENTSVVGITKVGSVWVTGGAAVIAVCLSFVNIFIKIIDTIPAAVIGGVCLILYGFIAANGLKMLIDSKVDMTEIRNLIIVSVMLVIGLGGAVIKIGEQGKFEGAALAMIAGIILNLILPKEKKGDKKAEEIGLDGKTEKMKKPSEAK